MNQVAPVTASVIEQIKQDYPQLVVTYIPTTDNILVTSAKHDVGFAITANTILDGVWEEQLRPTVLSLDQLCARLDAGETVPGFK